MHRIYYTISVFFLIFAFIDVSFAKVFGDNGKIIIKDAWVRSSLPGVPVSACYMTIENRASSDDSLISVSTNICKYTELHTMIYKDDIMSMRKIDEITIPKKTKFNGKVHLKPKGLHIMLIKLKQKLQENKLVSLKLNFKHSKSIVIKAPVKVMSMKMMHFK